ncbi:MAG: DNA polymerase Y family protein [Alphaproteobacteria bacterium]|nr:DNA polymerase Y family protein [Alphaproteobacteria bacterium]
MFPRRFASLYFPNLLTDWLVRRDPALAEKPFAICRTARGRRFVFAPGRCALESGVLPGMSVADARALEPELELFAYEEDRADKLLASMADWSIRYTPLVSLSPPDGLVFDITGCAHLLGGEWPMLQDIRARFGRFGYDIRVAMADTPGAAWAFSRYGRRGDAIIPPGGQKDAIGPLPAAALRLDEDVVLRLNRLGLKSIRQLIGLPRASLTRRFGRELCRRLDQALGEAGESLLFHRPEEPYMERLPCLEPVIHRAGIDVALQDLARRLCQRLSREKRGLRRACLAVHRVDGRSQSVEIGTGRPTRSEAHILRLFSEKLGQIAPGFGIELFVLTAPHTEEMTAEQDGFLESGHGGKDTLPELADRLATRLGRSNVYRLLPRESHIPERAVRRTSSFDDTACCAPWPANPRPLHLLRRPEPIEATAPVPDYPPMLFRHKGALHRVRRADGPERIEPEWWRFRGPARDYFRVEDESGQRYWVYRSGAYRPGESANWFLHGYFS